MVRGRRAWPRGAVCGCACLGYVVAGGRGTEYAWLRVALFSLAGARRAVRVNVWACDAGSPQRGEGPGWTQQGQWVDAVESQWRETDNDK
jgi:hypothetical protein